MKNPHLTFRTLIAVCGLACATGMACARFGQLNPKAQRTLDIFECRVAVVKEYSGDVMDAEELVRDVIRQRTDLASAFLLLGATVPEAQAAVQQFLTCDPDTSAAPSAASVRIVAPPPASGNKVL